MRKTKSVNSGEYIFYFLKVASKKYETQIVYIKIT